LFIKTIPQSSFLATPFASSKSFHITTADNQKSLPLASSIASSIVEYFITEATGQNISSLKLLVSFVTSANTVGGKKYHFLSSIFHQVTNLAQESIAFCT
jgi:hypothetical protein